eukprot:UN28589
MADLEPTGLKKPEDAPAPMSFLHILLVVFCSATCGLVFGSMLTKSRVFEPNNIRGVFLFKKWLMLKIFLSAMGSGAICLALLSKVMGDYFETCRRKWCSIPFGSTLIGAFILGSGMAISGACPGMVIAQVGAGVENMGYTVGGCFTGALTYGLLQSFITDTINKNCCTFQFEHPVVDKYFGKLFYPGDDTWSFLLWFIYNTGNVISVY